MDYRVRFAFPYLLQKLLDNRNTSLQLVAIVAEELHYFSHYIIVLLALYIIPI